MLHVVEVNGQQCVPWNGEMVPVGSKQYYEIVKAEQQRAQNSSKEKKHVRFLPGGESHAERAIATAHSEVFRGASTGSGISHRDISP